MFVPTGRVLIVDDLPDMRTTLAGLVADEGFEVCAVASHEEALEVLAARRFHVAVLDVCLEGEDGVNRDGLDLMHELHVQYPGIAVIILTGFADVEMVQEARQPDDRGVAPAFSFLQKTQISTVPEQVHSAFRYAMRRTLLPVKELVARGEGDHLEFKASMRKDLASGNVNKELQRGLVAAIAGMLNGDGGVLLVGVADDGTILGIQHDLETLRRPNTDSFKLMLSDLVTDYLGLECLDCVQVGFEDVDGKLICVVHIDRSPKPVFFVRGSDHVFCLRVNNSTRSLDPKDTWNYIQANANRFK